MIQKVIAAIVALASFVGLAFSLEAHWATKSEFVQYTSANKDTIGQVRQELAAFKTQYELDVMDQKISRIQEQIWKLDDRIAEIMAKKANQAIKQEVLDQLNAQKRDLQNEMDNLKKKRQEKYEKALQ